MAEITRRSVLLAALEREEAEMAACSKDGKKLEPMRGLETIFDEQQQKCHILREMIQALESEPVRQGIATWQQWQKDVAAGKKPDLMEIVDRVPPVESEGQTRMVF